MRIEKIRVYTFLLSASIISLILPFNNAPGPLVNISAAQSLDVFAIETGNLWNYQVTSQTETYAREDEVLGLDAAYQNPTFIVESRPDNGPASKIWYEKTPGELRLVKPDVDTTFDYIYPLVCWYPMQVGEQKYTKTTSATWSPDPLIPFDVSMTVDVLAKEDVNLSFDTFEAYKLRYIFRIWGWGMDVSETFYYWWVPYLGFIKYEDSDTSEELTSFALVGGIITKDTDSDSDGLKDYQEEIFYETDRLNADSDNDGLTDGEEVNTYGTDPNDNDSDGDGLTDGDEVNTHGTDPANSDSDNDGLTDFEELNTYNTLPTDEDSDNDGLNDGDEIALGTDPNDPDTDGDGMLDGWEDTYGLNPLADDEADDVDGDGLTNLQEYNLGRHPTNVEPDKPVLYLPLDNETDVVLTPELETHSFTDLDGHDHSLTQWQIGKQSGGLDPCPETSFTNSDYVVFDGTSDAQLTTFNVPDFLLDVGTGYCWRTKFTDTGNAVSDWADPFSFSTVALSEDDQSPQNGIPDEQEIDCTEMFNPDPVPPNTVCVNTMVGNARIGIEGSTNVTSIQTFKSVDPQTVPENLSGVTLLNGLMSFKAEVANVGDRIEIVFHSDEPLPDDVKCYKYDPVSGWQDYSGHIVAISADRKAITLEYQDGDFGDLDGVANKFVLDPVGFGVASQGGGGGGGGGG